MTPIPTRANIKPTFHGKTPDFSSVFQNDTNRVFQPRLDTSYGYALYNILVSEWSKHVYASFLALSGMCIVQALT